MKRRTLLALILAALQCATLYVLGDAVAFPLAALAAALALAFMGRRFTPSRDRQIYAALGLAVVYFIKWRIWPGDTAYASIMPNYGASYAAAQYFITLQVAAFALRAPDGAPREAKPSFTALAIIGMVFAANRIVPLVPMLATWYGVFVPPYTDAIWYQFLSTAFAFTIAAYYLDSGVRQAHAPRIRRIALGLILAAAIGLGYVAGAYLFVYGREIDQWLFQHAPAAPSSVAGFSRNARLDSMTGMRTKDGEALAVRVIADDAPGYLRGMAYDLYDPPRWRASTPGQALEPAWNAPEDLPVSLSDGHVFALRPGASGPWTRQEVWPVIATENALFTSLDTAWLGVRTDTVDADADISASVESAPTSHVNIRAGAIPVEALSEEERQRLTILPADLDPRITALAQSLTAGRQDALAKIAAVLAYFRSGFEYGLNIQAPVGEDPLTYFLLERPAAHCEYFASGATVLLRASGVPCRYVNGYVVSERNETGGFWVARRRDAHAWAEAWIPAQGWMIVEATPPSGLPEAAESSALSDAWDAIRFQLRRSIDGVRQWLAGTLPRLCAQCWRSIQGPPLAGGIILLLGVLGSAIGWRMRRRYHRHRVSPAYENLRRLLADADAQMKRLGYKRPPQETLHQFAARLRADGVNEPWRETAAAWYEQYAGARYGPQPESAVLERLLLQKH